MFDSMEPKAQSFNGSFKDPAISPDSNKSISNCDNASKAFHKIDNNLESSHVASGLKNVNDQV
jgi:hypothetical protein